MTSCVVLDTNVLVSAALWPHSPPGQALRRVVQSESLLACEESLAELERVLMRPKFDRFAPRETRGVFTALVRSHAEMVSVQTEHHAQAHGACRDPDDALFLALALAAQADTIVSGDADLLTLNP